MGRKDIKQKMNQTQTAMQIFEYQGNEVRTIQHGDEVWWVLRDVCRVLGMTTPAKVARRLDDDEKGVSQIHTPGGTQEVTIVNEPGLYSVILRSDKPEAKAFKRWVTHDILPSIRKHGAYISGQEDLEMTREELLAKAFVAVNEISGERLKRINQLEEKIRKDEPKVAFANAVTASKDCIRIRELAKILKQNGVNTGQNKLFADLRRNGYLISEKGPDYNTPTQKSLDLGLFEIAESIYVTKSGEVHINKTAMVTPKGQTYFIRKITKYFGIDLAQPRIRVAQKAG
mgnify:FL=1